MRETPGYLERRGYHNKQHNVGKNTPSPYLKKDLLKKVELFCVLKENKLEKKTE